MFVRRSEFGGMNDMTGYRIIALLLIAAGLTLVPWYALQDSFYAFKWIATFDGKDFAPALIQIPSYGKVWLILLPALLLATVGLYARPVNTLSAPPAPIKATAFAHERTAPSTALKVFTGRA